jgi:serine/threonine protein kinase
LRNSLQKSFVSAQCEIQGQILASGQVPFGNRRIGEPALPVPRIIDFGLAKATSQRLTEETLFTHAGAIVGTPAYMSPEQADSTGDVDTRTDVYSLGVVLYELLVGVVPLEFQKLAFSEILRRLRDICGPDRPSH